MEAAELGLFMISACAFTVLFFDSRQVSASFSKGAILLDGTDRNYMVHTSRRDKPGLAEIHTLDTDIIYVMEGTTTFVTGGKAVETREIAANEIRGSRIEGGDTRQLSKDDVIIVPNGTPHWFKEVSGAFLYYTIKDGTQTILADSYQGKRLNSPNDLVYRSDGTLFFTDPPFGFPRAFEDTRKQLPFSGVFSIYKGKLQLVSKDFSGPNGIALSPDEKYLYVGNWPRALTGQHPRAGDDPVSDVGEKHKAITRYEVQPDGTLKNGKLFFDFTSAPGEDGLDGIKVDQKGNLYVSAPGGLWVISPEGKHLGTIITPRHAHNFNWGDADGRTLYLCARSGLYRMRLNVPGVRP